jgi:hypothetical protein
MVEEAAGYAYQSRGFQTATCPSTSPAARRPFLKDHIMAHRRRRGKHRGLLELVVVAQPHPRVAGAAEDADLARLTGGPLHSLGGEEIMVRGKC